MAAETQWHIGEHCLRNRGSCHGQLLVSFTWGMADSNYSGESVKSNLTSVESIVAYTLKNIRGGGGGLRWSRRLWKAWTVR